MISTRTVRKIHRILGLLAAVFFLNVAVTGLLLNHQIQSGPLEKVQYMQGQAGEKAVLQKARFGPKNTAGVNAREYRSNPRANFLKTLHAIRIFGRSFTIIADLTALALIMSTVTGIVLYIRTRN